MAEESPAKTPDVLQLAFERTFLAHERTLMAWIRTATALIAFGIALYDLVGYVHQMDPVKEPPRILGGRIFGVLMIVIGLLTLALASWQHRLQIMQLRTHYANTPRSLSLVIAGLIAGMGFVALVAAILASMTAG